MTEDRLRKKFQTKNLSLFVQHFLQLHWKQQSRPQIIPCTQAGVVRGGKFISLVGINLGKHIKQEQNDLLAIYAPMIYMASYAMFLMRADPLRGQVGEGFGPGN